MSAIILLTTVYNYFNLHSLFLSALLWVKSLGSTGIIAFIIIYNLATVLFIPGSLLTLGGGALYGMFFGTVYVIFAAILGATFAFLIGRYFAKNWVSKQMLDHPKFQAIDQAVAKEGFKIVLLARLSPVFPFNLLNYVLGVTSVSLQDYILGSLGMIPGTLMYVYLGSLAGDITLLGTPQDIGSGQIAQWIVRIIGCLATVGVTIYITHISKKALTQKLHPENPHYDTFK